MESGGPVKLREFGTIRVGMQIPAFEGASGDGVPIGPATPPGQFFLHVISDKLPPTCLDQECGDDAPLVVAKGGHVIGGSDGKYARALGVQLVSTHPFRLDPPLVVVTDAGGRVSAIWKNAGCEHMELILRKEGL